MLSSIVNAIFIATSGFSISLASALLTEKQIENLLGAGFILGISGLLAFLMVLRIKKEKKRIYQMRPLPPLFNMEEVDRSSLPPSYQKCCDHIHSLPQFKIDGENIHLHNSRKSVDAGYAILEEMIRDCETNPELIYWANLLGEDLNKAQARALFDNRLIFLFPSIALLLAMIVALFFSLFPVLLGSSSASSTQISQYLTPLIIGWTKSLVLLLCFLVIYYYSLRKPAYQLLNPDPMFYRFLKSLMPGFFIGALGASIQEMGTTYTTAYFEKGTNTLIRKDVDYGCFTGLMALTCLCTLLPFMMAIHGLISFFKNYVLNK